MGSKWKVLILQELQKGAIRFNDLKKKLPGISQHVLSATLKSMDEDGIVSRALLAPKALCVEYSLSELGQSLIPVLEAMRIWGLEYQKFCEGRVIK